MSAARGTVGRGRHGFSCLVEHSVTKQQRLLPGDCYGRCNDFSCVQLYSSIVSLIFIPWEVWVAFPGESQLGQNRANLPTVQDDFLW